MKIHNHPKLLKDCNVHGVRLWKEELLYVLQFSLKNCHLIFIPFVRKNIETTI